MNRRLRELSLLLAGLMLVSVTAGCKSRSPAGSASQSQSSGNASSVYPLSGDVHLTYWIAYTPSQGNPSNFGENPIAKELAKKTGVTVTYEHPPTGSEKDQFNVMVASGDLPDMIQWGWTTSYPGGPKAAINNGLIRDLTDTVNKYAPNLKKYLKAHPTYDKDSKTDDGKYYMFPFVRDGKILLMTSGPIVRKDWLDDCGLSVPETMDDWVTMLQAFKAKEGASVPLSTIGTSSSLQVASIFQGGFGTYTGFYQENGKVKYGFMENGYKDMLTYLNKLYTSGLLDPNFTTTDTKTRDSNLMNGKSGATYGPGGSGIGVYIPTMQAKNSKYDLVAAPFPVLKKSDKITHGGTTTGVDPSDQTAITTKCKNVMAAARFLDYGYSEGGRLLYNFGIEGTSYTMANNAPTYTDEVLKNPQGKSVAAALAMYAKAGSNGPFAQDPGYIEQYYVLPQQKNALKVWSDNNCTASALGQITLTSDESSQYSQLMSDINTYAQEEEYKFIMGKEPLSNWDSYVGQLKKMSIDKAIQLNQAAYNRYAKR